jgi:Zn-dependent M28 family amino/carboxypeptidase
MARRLLRIVLALSALAAIAAICVILMLQPGVRAVATHPPAANAGRLAADVRLLSVALHPRSYDDPDHLDAAAAYIAEQFAAAGARVDTQDVPLQDAHYRNVIGRFGPADGPLIVVGAHYDAWGLAGAQPDVTTPGADDNASGVAGLLELARMLGRDPPKTAVELVAYPLEEPPHFRTDAMGSAWHASRLRAQGRDVRLMLSLEMIGYFSDAPRSQRYPLPGMSRWYGDRGDYIALVGRYGDFAAIRRAKALMAGASVLPVRTVNAPPLLIGIDFSDHLNYWRQGFPALMVTDTAFYRNTQYHLPGDTTDRLDYRRMACVVQGVFAVVRNF